MRDSAGRIAFTYPDFTRFQVARFCTVIASEMQSVAVGWQVYEITRRPLDLGYVGLAQFLPGILLFLVSGHAADRFERRRTVAVCYGGYAICSALLLTLALQHVHSVRPIYAVLLLVGVCRSFSGPAAQSLLPQLLPEEHFPNALTWSASIFQTATILGPSLGGLIYAFTRGPSVVFASSMLASLLALLTVLRIGSRGAKRMREPLTLATVLAGFRYIWQKRLILALISLDLFAVLLGGAVALLPVYAREILHTGPWGLGVLRSAPGAGAALTAILLAYRPLRRRAGKSMLWCVAGFGLSTMLFGISRSLTLSLISLMLVGATDMVSIVVRGTLVQLATPDEMRGRVSSINSLFIGASNEVGQFESGLTAHWFGAVPAVVIGGAGTLVVVALWAWWFPELRRADRLAGTVDGPAALET